MTIKTKFDREQEVMIVPLENLKGKVESIWLTANGLKYEVRYFYNAVPHIEYFYEDELKGIN